jgi:type II secretory pathway component PulC
MRIKTLALFGLATFAPLGLGTSGFADPAPVRRVVGHSLSATQAVLFDEDSGEYRVVRLGDELNGSRVVAIGAEDVILIRGGTQETIKLAPDPRPRARVIMEPLVINIRPMNVPMNVAATTTAAPPAAVAVVPAPVPPAPTPAPAVAVAAPPIAAPAASAPVVVAAPPHGSSPVVLSVPKNGTVVVQPPGAAPVTTAETGSRTEAPPATEPTPTPVVATPAPPAAPAITPPPASAPPAPTQLVAPPAGPSVTQVPRAELERGLGDFQTLDASVAIEVAPQGGFRVAELRSGSFLNRMGLQKGDVILRVDGRALRTAEDASAAYNWVRVADHFVVDLVRDGQPLTLRFRVA